MFDPFVSGGSEEERETALLEQARGGNAGAVETLVKLHQPWIFNIVLRMVSDYHEAEDLTQDILLRSFTKLSSFKGRSRFRTWLYRIAVNRVLRLKETGREKIRRKNSKPWADDEYVEAYLAREAPDRAGLGAEIAAVAWEVRAKCLLGMLLCLKRKQRLAFILGAVLAVNQRTAAEIMGTSAANFRQLLSRSRRRLWNFLNERCGLINPDKPCTCERSVNANIASGYVDPLRLVFGGQDAPRIRDLVARTGEQLDHIRYAQCEALYRDHPFQDSPDFAARVRAIIEGKDCQSLLETIPHP